MENSPAPSLARSRTWGERQLGSVYQRTVVEGEIPQHHSPAHLFCQHLQLHVGHSLGLAQVEDEASSCQGPYL